MKKTIFTFGLISGAVSALMMACTMPFEDKLGDHGYVIGYTAIVLSFLLVYFGIRSYRDNVGGGQITFGKAFGVGICITLISCVCYVLAWEILYHIFMPDFWDKYVARMVEKLRASGASAVVIQAQVDQMKMYANPLINIAMTFIEPFPVGLVITLVSAAILRKKAKPEAPQSALSAAS